MSINYGKLDLPREGEVSLADVVEQLKIPRRTVLRYAEVFGDFVPNAVRKPSLGKPEKRGRRRILYFEAVAFDILPTIRDLSRRRLPHNEIREILVASKEGIISTRTKEKITPIVEELKRRKNSLPQLKELHKDFDYAPVAEGIAVLEDEFGVWLPVNAKQVGEDRYEKVVFLINALFLFHFREKLSGVELGERIKNYLSNAHTTSEEEEKLRDWLGERLGLAGRWKKKNRLVVDQLTYELIERGGMTFLLVKECFETCFKRILVTHLVNMPVVGVLEIRKSWLLLIETMMGRRKLVVSVGVTDNVIDVIVRDWEQLFEAWKENLIEL